MTQNVCRQLPDGSVERIYEGKRSLFWLAEDRGKNVCLWVLCHNGDKCRILAVMQNGCVLLYDSISQEAGLLLDSKGRVVTE